MYTGSENTLAQSLGRYDGLISVPAVAQNVQQETDTVISLYLC